MTRSLINLPAWALLAALSLLLPPGQSTSTSSDRQDRGERPDREAPLRMLATLVQVPTVVTDRSGKFVFGLGAGNFTVWEDGKRQQITAFATVKQPFNAVLILDTSNCAQERLRAIQHAAAGFLEHLGPEDRVMAISFDDDVHRLTDLTSDRNEVETAILSVESGFGKLLYEAMAEGLSQLRGLEGRRAIILFSDGVDLGSIAATAKSTLGMAEEIGAVIYVVHIDTRWWIEAEARRQRSNRKDSKVPFSVDVRIPLPPDFGGPDPTPTGMPPKPRSPRIEIGSSRPSPQAQTGSPDEITTTLDKLYGEADGYLESVTSGTAGRIFRPDNFGETRSAFAAIAEELRNQYLIGYYAPDPARRAQSYRTIKVEVARKGAVVRARPGYRLTPR